MHFETLCVMALQGRPRSLILNSNLGPILPRFRDTAGFLFKTAPYPYSTLLLRVFPLD